MTDCNMTKLKLFKLTKNHYYSGIRPQVISDSAGVSASHTSSLTDCQYIGVCGSSPVSDSLSQSIVAGAISGERLSILHPGDSGGWRHSRHTCQCTTLLLVGQVCDDGKICGRREDDIITS